MTPIPRALRAAAAAALLTLCAGPAATAAPTNQPTRVTTGLAINTNGVVKLPAGALYWPTQTNYFHRATVTNLTVSTITGVDATEVAVADSGNYFTGTNAETVLQELGASVAAAVGDLTAVQVSGGLLTVSSGTGPVPTVGLTTSAVRNATAIYLPLAGGAMTGPLTGALTIQDAEPALFLAGTADDQGYMSLSSTPGSYPANLGLILGSDTSAAQDRAAIYMVAQTSTRGKMVFQTANNSGVLTNALTLDYDQSATFNGAISGNGSGITNVPLATATGDIPAGGFGEVALQWTDKDFNKVEGTTNSVGWVGYDISTGSRRFNIDSLCSAITTDQAAVLVSSIKRVPRGFTAFKSSGALRVTWVCSSADGDNEIREVIVTGYSDLTSAETVILTDTTTRDVVSAGVPAVFTANLSGAVPQWIGVQVKFSVEDGDKSGIILVEVLSQ